MPRNKKELLIIFEEIFSEKGNIKKKINLNESSKVIIFGCEGDADEELYQKLLNS